MNDVAFISKMAWLTMWTFALILYGALFLILLPFEALSEIGNQQY